jgi:hypothetical protein
VRRTPRLATALVVGLLVLLTGGCAKLRSIVDPDSSPSPLSYDWPAAASGAACALLDFGAVAQAVGTTFDTAAGAKVAQTNTCAETQRGHDLPVLTLSISPTKADDLIFSISVEPTGSSPVKGLGRAAYLLPTGNSGTDGPSIEYGWLSSRPYLLVLRYTFAPGAKPADVTAMWGELLALAKSIEAAA